MIVVHGSERSEPLSIENLVENIVGCIELLGQIDFRYYEPENNPIGNHLIEMAPALMEIDMPTEADGEEVFDFMHHIDLLAMQSASGRSDGSQLIVRAGRRPTRCQSEGQIEGQECHGDWKLHLSPFEDAEVIGVI